MSRRETEPVITDPCGGLEHLQLIYAPGDGNAQDGVVGNAVLRHNGTVYVVGSPGRTDLLSSVLSEVDVLRRILCVRVMRSCVLPADSNQMVLS